MNIKTPLSTKTLWLTNGLLLVLIFMLSLGMWLWRSSKGGQHVPRNAIALIKYGDATEVNSTLPFFENTNNFLEEMLQDLKTEDKELFLTSDIQFSLHKESKTDFDFIAYFSKSKEHAKKLKNTLLNKQKYALKYFEQDYEGAVIHQVKSTEGIYKFGFILSGDQLVVSKSNLLLELFIDEQKINPKRHFKWSLSGEPSTKSILFHSQNLNQLKDYIPNNISENFLSFLQQALPKNPELLLKENDSTAVAYLVGDRPRNDIFLNIFKGLKSQDSVKPAEILPSCSLLLSLNVDNPVSYFTKYNEYTRKYKPTWATVTDSLSTYLEIERRHFQSYCDGVFTYMELEKQADEGPRRILLLQSEKSVLLESYLKELANRARKLRITKSPLRTSFGQTEIYDLNIPNFPGHFINSMFGGFKEVFFAKKGSNLIFSNNRLGLVDYLVQLEEGTTQTLDKKSNTSVLWVYISPSKTWRQLYKGAPTEKVDNLSVFQNHFMNLRWLELSFNPSENTSKLSFIKNKSLIDYTNAIWVEDESLPIKTRDFLDWDTQYFLYLSSDSKIGLVHKNERRIVFEKFSTLSSFDNYQFTDFISNGKQDVLVMDKNKMYLFSLNRQKQIAERTLFTHKTTISSFDVRPEGIYFIDVLGNLYLYDKVSFQVNNIELNVVPLNPNKLYVSESQGVAKALVLCNNGALYAYYISSGVLLKDYPLQLVESKPAAMLYNKAYSQGRVQVLTEQGVLSTWNIKEQKQEKNSKQIERGSKFLKFEIVWNQKKTDWLMLRRGQDMILVLDKKGRPILEVEQPYGKPIDFSWFYDSKDNKFLCIFDGQKNQVYNLQGERVGHQNINALGPPFLYSTMSELILLNPMKQELETWSIKSK